MLIFSLKLPDYEETFFLFLPEIRNLIEGKPKNKPVRKNPPKQTKNIEKIDGNYSSKIKMNDFAHKSK